MSSGTGTRTARTRRLHQRLVPHSQPPGSVDDRSCGRELFACCGVHAFRRLCPGCPCSENKCEDDGSNEHALGAVHGDPDPGALIPLRRVREGEHVEQDHRNLPRNVQVIRREEDAVRDPVAPPEGAVHPRQEEPAKEEFLAECRVEDEDQDRDCEPAPVPAEETLTGVRAEKRAEVSVVWIPERRDEYVCYRVGQDKRKQYQPDPAAGAACAGSAANEATAPRAESTSG